MRLACVSWIAVFSLSGFIWTMVTTGVFSRMNSPGCTSRSETEPATGALMAESASFFWASSSAVRRGRLQTVRRIERCLVVGFGHFQARVGGVALDLRQKPAAVQLP